MKGWQIVVAAAAVLWGVSPAGGTEGPMRPHAFTISPMAGAYFFDSKQDLKTSTAYTLAIGYSFTDRWTGEITTGFIDTRSETGGMDQVDGYPLRLDVLYHFRHDRRFIPYFALGFGGLWLDDPGGETNIDAVFAYGGGAKLFITEAIALRADIRQLYTLENLRFEENDGMNNLAAVAGISFQIGGDFAPPPQVDTDGDGVIDAFDRCPDTRLGVPVDGFGCPTDVDHDGVPDYLDRCPGTPAGVRVNKDGCPVDTDRDGVPDYLDRCPGTVGVKVDAWGCPVGDRDGDGVPDASDACPDTPAGTKVDSSGCPEGAPPQPLPPATPPPAPSKDAGQSPATLSLRLEFAPGRADIRPEFKGELNRAANFIRANPDRTLVVEGHTDSVGPADINLELSRRRAEIVRAHLVTATGVPAERIKAVGFGESRPIADNSTQEGRQRNRRVVISIEGG